MAKSPNISAKIWCGLTVHIRFFIFKNLQAKISKFTFCLLVKISSKLYKFRAIHPRIPQMMQNSHHLLTHYTLCFQMPNHRQRTL